MQGLLFSPFKRILEENVISINICSVQCDVGGIKNLENLH